MIYQDRTSAARKSVLQGQPCCVDAGGILLRCRHCDHVRFVSVTAPSVSLSLPFLELLSEGLTYHPPLQAVEGELRIYACTRCGCLHQFLKTESGQGPVERPVEEAEDRQCVARGDAIAPALEHAGHRPPS